jgi:tetratricopeptide (TPR) repeat protein
MSEIKSVSDYFDEGVDKFYQLNDYEAAIKEFNKAIELQPDYIEAYYYRGLSKMNNNNFVEAVKDFNKALEIIAKSKTPKNLHYQKDILYNLGRSKYNLEDYEGTKEIFGELLKENANSALSYYYFGVSNYMLKNYEIAIESFNN